MSEYSYEKHEPRTVEEVAALLATGKPRLGLTNDEFTRVFQHFVDTDTLPLDMRYILMLTILVEKGVVTMPTAKRAAWESLWNSKGGSDDL